MAASSAWAGRADPWWYDVPAEVVERYLTEWSLPPGKEALVELWINKLLATYTGRGVFFPVRYRVGTTVEDGVMLCVSTGGSTNVSKQTASSWYQIVHGGVPKPEYLFFEAYFYPKLVFMNIKGFTEHQYAAYPVGTFENVLDQLCVERLPKWRDLVFVRDQEFIYEKLDCLLGMVVTM